MTNILVLAPCFGDQHNTTQHRAGWGVSMDFGERQDHQRAPKGSNLFLERSGKTDCAWELICNGKQELYLQSRENLPFKSLGACASQYHGHWINTGEYSLSLSLSIIHIFLSLFPLPKPGHWINAGELFFSLSFSLFCSIIHIFLPLFPLPKPMYLHQEIRNQHTNFHSRSVIKLCFFWRPSDFCCSFQPRVFTAPGCFLPLQGGTPKFQILSPFWSLGYPRTCSRKWTPEFWPLCLTLKVVPKGEGILWCKYHKYHKYWS